MERQSVALDVRDWRRIAIVVAFGLVVSLGGALLKGQPGYMDADYQTAIGRCLAAGQGFSEPFVWNFLDGLPAIPHPSHTYWSPLPAILVAGAIRLLGDTPLTIQLPFCLATALLCGVTYGLARRLGARRTPALLTGTLVPFAGFYAAYWSSPDSFAPFALFGALCLAGVALWRRPAPRFAAGLAAGLGHLARPDGLLLPVLSLAWLAWRAWRTRREGTARRELVGTAAFLIGYLVVMAPWLVRIQAVTGQWLSGGGLRTAFLLDYDQLYALNHLPTLAAFLAQGAGTILSNMGRAAADNLATLAGGLFFFLVPLSAIGLWRNRRSPLVRLFALYGAGLLAAMSVVFPKPGVRGAFFHSAGALLPILFAASLPGLESALGWVVRHRRGWRMGRAWRMFGGAAIALALVMGTLLYARSVALAPIPWKERDATYPLAAAWVLDHAGDAAPVMVVNPPTYYDKTSRPCVAIPSDGWDALREVSTHYGVRYLLLQSDHPAFLDPLWSGGEAPEGLAQAGRVENRGSVVLIYEIR